MHQVKITKGARAEELKTTIVKLENNPEKKGRDCGGVMLGLRSISHEDHYFVFYRTKGQMVEILRILHQRRDWKKLFQP